MKSLEKNVYHEKQSWFLGYRKNEGRQEGGNRGRGLPICMEMQFGGTGRPRKNENSCQDFFASKMD